MRAAFFRAGLRIGGDKASTLSNASLLLEHAHQAQADGNRVNLVTALRF